MKNDPTIIIECITDASKYAIPYVWEPFIFIPRAGAAIRHHEDLHHYRASFAPAEVVVSATPQPEASCGCDCQERK